MSTSRRSNRPTNPANHSEREADCRKILAKLNFGASVWEFGVSRDVIEALEERGLVRITTCSEGEMLYEATSRAFGYCSDPSTFEL